MKDIRVLLIFFTISATHSIKQCPKEHDFGTDLLLVHNDCDKFYICTFGQPVEMLCPAGLKFNPKISKCDWKPNVDCGRNESGEDQAQSENSEAVNNYDNESKENNYSKEWDVILDESNLINETSDHEYLENGCPINSSSHWLLPHEDNCNLFYYCVRGEKLQRQCPSSLHFNSHLQICDWPDKAGCNDSSNNSSESEIDDSQEDTNTSQEDSHENGNSQEDYTSEEDSSDEDETKEDDNTEESSLKKIEAIVTVNLKTMIP